MGKEDQERVNCGIHRRHGVGPREAAAAVLLQHKDEPEGLALLREQRAEGAPYCKV